MSLNTVALIRWAISLRFQKKTMLMQTVDMVPCTYSFTMPAAIFHHRVTYYHGAGEVLEWRRQHREMDKPISLG